jgi:uncharacterized LabA/DUF88 family protein
MTEEKSKTERVAILVDGPQVYGFRSKDKNIDPRKLLYTLANNRKIVNAHWYVELDMSKPEAMPNLITWLMDFVIADRSGYDLILSREDIDPYIIIDIWEIAQEKLADTIILVSGDAIFAKPVRMAKWNGIKVEVASTKKWERALAETLEMECDRFIELADLEERILRKG